MNEQTNGLSPLRIMHSRFIHTALLLYSGDLRGFHGVSFLFFLSDRHVGKKPIHQSSKTKSRKARFLVWTYVFFMAKKKEIEGDTLRMPGVRRRWDLKQVEGGSLEKQKEHLFLCHRRKRQKNKKV